MKQFVSRRRRCWTLLVQMDTVIFPSEGHRSDMLLSFSGWTREERVMIQGSIGNERDSDRVAEALIIQHPRMALYENRRQMDRDTRKGKGKNKNSSARGGGFTSRWSRSKGKGKSTAYYAEHRTYDDYNNDDDAVDPVDSYQSYNDPAGPDTDDGDDVPHEHDDEHDTSSSYIAVDTSNANAAAELDAIALVADTWDVDLMSDLELSAQVV